MPEPRKEVHNPIVKPKARTGRMLGILGSQVSYRSSLLELSINPSTQGAKNPDDKREVIYIVLEEIGKKRDIITESLLHFGLPIFCLFYHKISHMHLL